jgi:hypothetical protein
MDIGQKNWLFTRSQNLYFETNSSKNVEQPIIFTEKRENDDKMVQCDGW